MGESLIVQRGGSVFKLPVLSPLLPADLTVKEAPLLNARFSVEIQNPGTPAQYTYQWFLDGSPVSGATESSCVINQGVARGEHFIYCLITNKAGTVSSRSALFTIKSYVPSFSYTGLSQIIDEGNFNWKLKLLSTGTLTFIDDIGNIDVFLVGGGGGGGYDHGGGGGGGYTKTSKNLSVLVNNPYAITIGAGGANGVHDVIGGTGGTTSAFGVNAAGGIGGETYRKHNSTSTTTDETIREGGAGGSGGGCGVGFGGSRSSTPGSSDGGSGVYGAKGQGTTTREFAEPDGTLYAGGGGGQRDSEPSRPGGAGGGGTGDAAGGTNGETNTGGGGGGSGYPTTAGAGGSGIVIIRNHRG